MAEVVPFRGILYDTEKVDDMAAVVVPPFDVISREEQQSAYASHPYNMIRLELNKGGEPGGQGDTPHARAAFHFDSWLSEGVMMRDAAPAFYLTATDFPLAGRVQIRYGIIAAVRLEPFEKGVVLPHEKTFSRVRSERLELMKSCHANFSPIFAMFSDPRHRVLADALAVPSKRPPEIDFVDSNGHRHRLWRLTHPGLQQQISDALIDRRLYIADGHHRYETALAYRRWLEETAGPLPDGHPANFAMMYLSAMEAEGMVILPAHRLLNSVPAPLRKHLFEQAREYFDITKFSPPETGRAPDLGPLKKALAAKGEGTRIGVLSKNGSEPVLLALKNGVMERLYGDRIPSELIGIDVTALRELVFMKILNFDQARLDNHELIGYASTAEQALEKVASGEYDIAFLLNRTPIEQVKQVAEAGLIMPRKATYFYPKVISGLVIKSLAPGREAR